MGLNDHCPPQPPAQLAPSALASVGLSSKLKGKFKRSLSGKFAVINGTRFTHDRKLASRLSATGFHGKFSSKHLRIIDKFGAKYLKTNLQMKFSKFVHLHPKLEPNYLTHIVILKTFIYPIGMYSVRPYTTCQHT